MAQDERQHPAEAGPGDGPGSGAPWVDAAWEAGGDDGEGAVMVAARPVRRRWARRLAVAGGVLLILAGGAVWGVARLSHQQPAWWRPVRADDAAAEEAARRLENGAATEFTRVRRAELEPTVPAGGDSRGAPAQAGVAAPAGPGEPASRPWTVKVSEADANAWLGTRLKPWLESREDVRFTWPEGLGPVQVEFAGGEIRVGAGVTRGGVTRVVATTVRPEFREGGELWLPATGVSIGRLPMPASWVIRGRPGAGAAAGAAVPEELTRLPQARDVLDALAGAGPAMRSPVLKIGDGRRVRLVDLKAEAGALYATFLTLPREQERAER